MADETDRKTLDAQLKKAREPQRPEPAPGVAPGETAWDDEAATKQPGRPAPGADKLG